MLQLPGPIPKLTKFFDELSKLLDAYITDSSPAIQIEANTGKQIAKNRNLLPSIIINTLRIQTATMEHNFLVRCTFIELSSVDLKSLVLHEFTAS